MGFVFAAATSLLCTWIDHYDEEDILALHQSGYRLDELEALLYDQAELDLCLYER
ncbi:MAG: hypothetical protein QM689_12480 [Oscillospiraceae bacterium]